MTSGRNDVTDVGGLLAPFWRKTYFTCKMSLNVQIVPMYYNDHRRPLHLRKRKNTINEANGRRLPKKLYH